MVLFTEVQHLYTFNIVAPLFITFCQMFGRRRTPSARPSLPMFRTDRPIARISSRVLSGPSHWFLPLAKRSLSHKLRRSPTFFMTIQGVTLLLSRTSCTAGTGRFWNIHCTRPITVHVITSSSPKWKNHCEGPSTTQEMNLSVLQGGQYGTSTKMDVGWLIAIY